MPTLILAGKKGHGWILNGVPAANALTMQEIGNIPPRDTK
jgi:hypothetical protein